MSFVRITTDRALDEMKKGHEIYQLTPADLSISVAEWLTGKFVMEEAPSEACPPQRLKRQSHRKR